MSEAFSKCVKPWVHPRTTQEQRKKWKEEGREGGEKKKKRKIQALLSPIRIFRLAEKSSFLIT